MLTNLLGSLYVFIKALLITTVTTAVTAAIVTFLWNWQVVTIISLGLPILTFWQVFAIVGILQFIRIKI